MEQQMHTSGLNSRPRPGCAVAVALAVWAAVAPKAAPSQLERAVEKLFGKVMADALAMEYGLVEDPTLLGWVQQTGAQVAAASPRRGVDYCFQILDSDEVNALAAPDGYIFVTSGLLNAVSSDDELAAVLAHEVAHVAEKHFTDLLLPELAILAGLSAIKDPGYRDAVTATRISTLFLLLRWSRKNEAQADYEGMWYAFKAGYDPDGMRQFLSRLLAGRSSKRPNLGAIFETHPDPQRRYDRATTHPAVADDYATVLAIGDGLATRLHLSEAARRYEAAAVLRPDSPEPHLRLAAVLQRRGEFEAASAAYDRALALDPQCQPARDGLELLRSRPATDDGPPADAATREALRKAVSQSRASIAARPEAVEADLRDVEERLAEIARNRATNDLMEKTLVLRPKYEDVKWLYLVYEAQDLIIQSRRAENRLAQVRWSTESVLGDLVALHDRAVAALDSPLTTAQTERLGRLVADLQQSAGAAQSDACAAAQLAADGAKRLQQGVTSLTPALFDLNSPFETDRRLQYSRWAILEGAIARARHALGTALASADQASVEAATAGCRCHRIELNLQGLLASQAESVVFSELLALRLQCEPATVRRLADGGRPLGDIATALVAARALGRPADSALAAGGDALTEQVRRDGIDMQALRAVLRMAASDLQAQRTSRLNR
jgi:tetratricopeptide (TPR) repeat protein